jgi:hypothetical protein
MKTQSQMTKPFFYQLSKTHIIKSGMIAIVIIGFIAACSKDPGADPGNNSIDCSGAAKTFSTDVSPIIQHSCATSASCHGNGSLNGPGALTNYTQISNASTDIKNVVLSGRMPLNSSLSIQEKSAIVCWVNSGAPNN